MFEKFKEGAIKEITNISRVLLNTRRKFLNTRWKF